MKPGKERAGRDSVPFDRIAVALDRNRATRMLLDMLIATLPPDVTTSEIDKALYDLEDRVSKADRQALRTIGAGQYYIVAPVSVLRPPAPEAMAKITSALAALDDLGLLIETL